MKRLMLVVCVFSCFVMLLQGCDSNKKVLEEIEVEEVYSLKFPEKPEEFSGMSEMIGTPEYIYRLDWKDQVDGGVFYHVPMITRIQRDDRKVISIERPELKTDEYVAGILHEEIGGILHEQGADTVWLWLVVDGELHLSEYDNDLTVKSSFSLPLKEPLGEPTWAIKKIKGGFVFASDQNILKIADNGTIQIDYERKNKPIIDLCMIDEKTVAISEVADKYLNSIIYFIDLSGIKNPKEIKKQKMDGYAKFVQQIENGNILVETYGGNTPAYYILNSSALEINPEIKLDGFDGIYSSNNVIMPNEHDLYIYITEWTKGADVKTIKNELYIYRDGELISNVALSPTAKYMDNIYIDGEKLIFCGTTSDGYIVEHSCELKDVVK